MSLGIFFGKFRKKKLFFEFSETEALISKSEKKCSAVKIHYYDEGGHAWESTKYQGGVGYNKKVWKDATKKTMYFFNENKK